MNAVITMNEEIQKDSPAIMKEIKMDMDYDYYDYNADIEIQIPDEAINAEEQDLGNIPADDADDIE